MSLNICFPFETNSSLVLSYDANKDHNYEYPVQEVTGNEIDAIGSADELKQVLMEYALKKMHFAEPESVEYVRYKILESILSNEEIANITSLKKAYRMVYDLSIDTLNKIYNHREFFYSCFSSMDGAQISDFIDDYLLVLDKEDFFSLKSLLDQFFSVTQFSLPHQNKIGVYLGLSNFAARMRRCSYTFRGVGYDESGLEQAIEERLTHFSKEDEVRLYTVLQKEELFFNDEDTFSIERSLVFAFFVPDPCISRSKMISISHMIRISTLLCSLQRKYKKQYDDKFVLFRLLASALLEHECHQCIQNSLAINFEDSYSDILSKCFGIKVCLDDEMEPSKQNFVLKECLSAQLSTIVELKLRLAQSLGDHCASEIIRSINFTSSLLQEIYHLLADTSLNALKLIEWLKRSQKIFSLTLGTNSEVLRSLIFDALKYQKCGNDHFNRLPVLVNNFYSSHREDFYPSVASLLSDLSARQRSILLTAINSMTLPLHPWMDCMEFGERTFTIQGIQKILENHSNVLIREQCAAVTLEQLETMQWNCIDLGLKPQAYIIDHHGSHFLLLYVHKMQDRLQFIIFDSRSDLGSMKAVKECLCPIVPSNSDIICIESLEETGEKNRRLQLQNDWVNCSVFACEAAKLFIKKPDVVAKIISAKVPSNEKRAEPVSLFEVEYKKLPWQLFLTCQSMKLLRLHISLVPDDSKELFMRKRDKYVGLSSSGRLMNLRIDHKSRTYEKNLFKWALDLFIKK